LLLANGAGTAVILDGLTLMRGESYDLWGNFRGAGLHASDAGVTVRNCVFTRNGGAGGSGLHVQYGRLTLENSLFIENFTQAAASPVVRSEGNEAMMTGCSFVDNEGGGLFVDGSETIADCTFRGNRSSGLNVGWLGTPQVIRCAFYHNDAGGIRNNSGFPTVTDSVFLGNSSGGGGGVSSDGSIYLRNCLFSGNTSYFAGAHMCGYGTATLINCTFVNNFANGVGSVFFGGGGVIRNCIFWNNRSDTSFGAGIGVSDYPHRFPDVSYSILQNETQYYPGIGVIDVDPSFVDADGPDDIVGTEDDDLRTSLGSPAINAGDPNATGLTTTDLDGHARVLCDRVDIGAYELGIGDYNCDQSVDLSDFASWSPCMTGPSTADTAVPQGCESFDFNVDSAIDLLDFAAFQRILTAP